MSASRSRALRLPLGLQEAASGIGLSEGLAAALVACAMAVALGPWRAELRALVALVTVALAGGAHRWLSGGHRSSRRSQAREAWLVVDDVGIQRVDREKHSTLVDWREPFGATVFASPDRATLVLALTSPRAARYVSARVADARDASLARNVIRCATTAAESDLRVGHQAGLSAANAERLLSAIANRVPAALDRAYLSDAAGQPLVLDRTELCIGTRRIDLAAPLEWRAFVFQERGPSVLSLCQATWVRQGEAEVVLVAPIPADCAWVPEAAAAICAAGEERAVKQCVARDVRLMQAEVGEPPPRELRCAIDGLFMIPLRRALDRAPREARVPPPPPSPSVTATVPARRA